MRGVVDWKSTPEINAKLDEIDDSGLGDLYGLSLFWKHTVYVPSYRADPKWLDILSFTDAGSEVVEIVKHVKYQGSEADFRLALFRIFAYHDLIFNWRESDRVEVENLLRYELREGKLILPYRFGRLLYDRFNDQYEGSRTDHLHPDEVAQLLAETPQGVYQINSLLTGPLGLIHSSETRFLPPSLYLPLWHCSDTGCRTLHTVELMLPDIALTSLEHRIINVLKEKLGPCSEWAHCLTLRYLQTREHKARGLTYYDLPVLIADSIIGAERTTLLEAALSTPEGKNLRDVLGSRKKKAASGPPHAVASSLGPEEQLQLLLVLTDSFIIRLIDDLAIKRSINIPLGQIRRAHQKPPRLALSASSELSRLGLRSVKDDPVTTLVQLIHTAHIENNILGELLWRLGVSPNISPTEGLLDYVREKGPGEAVQNLVLSSQSVTQYICQRLQIVFEPIECTASRPGDQILWKMGFNPPQYDEFSQRLESHLARFNEAVLSMPHSHTDDDRERVRAAGVNLFVYVEEVIDMLVSYNVWLLITDHFLDSRFGFELAQARETVPDVLGANLEYDESTVAWNPDGENSLGVLLRYMSESVVWIEAIRTANREAWKRPAGDIPYYAEALERRFPFNHVPLWADTDSTEFGDYLENYKRIVTLLQQADLAFVRNGLDHMRDADRFPLPDKMLACVSRLREAHSLAVLKRYLPTVFWLESVEQNRFGILEYRLRDSAARLLVVYGPPMKLCLRSPDFSRPYVVAPGNLLGGPNAALVFGYKERTDYDEYWRNYPRRRRIPREDYISEEGISEHTGIADTDCQQETGSIGTTQILVVPP